MSNCFIILAAGQSKRFKSSKPKQYILYNNKPIYEHSVDKVLKSGLFKHIILVVKNNFFIKPSFFEYACLKRASFTRFFFKTSAD